MPVENGKNEQTSREDILPRNIVAAVKKRLQGLSLSCQLSQIRLYHRPKAWVARDQEVFTVKQTSNKRQYVCCGLGK
jgi:hypothetical protein